MAPSNKSSTSNNANASNKKSSKKQKQLQKRRVVESSDDDSTLSEILTPTNLHSAFEFIARINDMDTDSDDDEICDTDSMS